MKYTTTKTSSDQKDRGLGFDGLDSACCETGSTRYAGNQSGLKAKTNAGRGPTRGNTGPQRTPVNPPATATGKEQKRNPSGTKEFPRQGRVSFEMPQGPRKGVSQ